MAETRFCDCPNCGRTNVVGYKVESSNSKFKKVALPGYGVIWGGILGGPVGAGLGLAIGKLVGDKVAKAQEDDMLEYKFQCPKCGHKFSEYFEKI